MKFQMTVPETPIDPELGDHLFGERWLAPLTQQEVEEKEVLFLHMWNNNIWRILVGLGHDEKALDDFKQEVSYECPFDGNFSFYGVIPVAIMSDDISKYRSERFENESYDIFWDAEWMRDMGGLKNSRSYNAITSTECFLSERELESDFYYQLPLCGTERAFLGHGYTCGTLPTDGHGRLVQAKIPLDNKDFVGVITWIWYNK